MKKNLFLLVVGLLSSVMSFAQPEGWNDPTTSFTKTSTIVDGVEYYLYNVDADAWFAAGNNWWTAAVVYKTGDANLSAEGMEHGFKFKLTDKQNDGAYHINQFYGPNGKYSSVNNKWFLLTDRGDGAFFTDNSSGDTYWTFIPDNDGNFQIKSSKGNLKDNPVGLDPFTEDDGATARSGDGDKTGGANMTNKAEATCTTWALYCYGAPEAVIEWEAGCALVARMQEIYEDSKEKFDVSPYANQIGNQLGTIENAERLTALISQMNIDYMIWKVNEGGQKGAEVALVNPSFETGNMSGWSALEGTTLYAAQGNDSYDGKVGAYYAEFWHKNGNYSASQTVKDLPVGLYKLSANAYSSNGKAKLFANDVESDIIELSKRYSLVYELMLGADASITFGIKSSDDGNYWNCVDDFSLKYLGSGGVGYANTFDVDYTGKASKQYINGLEAKVADVRVAEGAEAVQAAYKAAKDYEDGELAENVAAWAKYEQLCADALVLANDPDFKDFATKLAGMVQNKYDIVENDPTTAELNEDYGKIQEEMNNVKSQIKPGTDITNTYLKNADFTKNIVGINEGDPTTGWRIDGTRGGGNWLINTGAKCGECWSGNEFDFYQIVENAPVGVYQIQVQGFTRAKRGNDAWNCYFDSKTGELLETPIFGDWTPNKANVYLNDNTGDLDIVFRYGHAVEESFFSTQIYTDPLGQKQYPDGLVSAGEAYANGEYKVSAFGLVAKQGDAMRIGVKGNNYGLDNWMCFTNFRLIYQGFDADIIRPEFQKAVASLDQAHIGTELQGELKTLQGEAAAVSQSEGKAMFDMLSKIYAFNTKKAASEEVFEELNTQNKNLSDVYTEYKDQATDDAIKKAQALQAKAVNAYAAETEPYLPTVTTEAAQEILAEFEPVIAALKIPKSAGSDENPVDFTSVIKNPNMASATGWTDETSGMAVDGTNKIAEFFNKENFNVYQQFTGLPEGLYEVTVQGYYRAGEIAQDWPALAAGTESNSMLYVINDNKTLVDEDPETPADTINCPLRHVAAEAIGEDPSISGTTTITPFAELGDETPWYMPNNLASGAQYFAGEFYKNTIYFYIWGPDDTVTLGIKKEGPAITNDWTAFSNWKLTGYGNMSEKEPGAQTQSCDPVTPVIGAIKGDVNGDGVVDGADIQEVINTILSGEYVEKADVNKDQVVDGADIQEIINIILGN